ncbi:MAG: GIY-YIG nuclease family protein [Pseudomonadota bacterium]
MYYVYVLQSEKDKKMYIGLTNDLKKRLQYHVSGKVTSTKCRLPLKLIFYEAYVDKRDAARREKYFKTSKGKTTLRSMLKEYLKKEV